jgi:uncharacterized protein (TIGR02646 family)
MRYINRDEIELRITETWKEDARKAFEEVKQVAVDERHAKTNLRAKVWQSIKALLASVSFEKCWYCEVKIERADGAVDHYRPKNKVTECPDHEGYWWLAFDWSNYRYSCTYCNSRRTGEDTTGGKHDHFPLLIEEDRAREPTDDLRKEKPILLDPMRAVDVTLLSFRPNGEPEPAYDESEQPTWYTRAKNSISLYHLDLAQTETARHNLFLKVKRLVADGDRFFDQAKAGNELAEEALDGKMDDLSELIRDRAALAGVARLYLQGFRSDGRDWVERVLTSC